MREAEPPIAGEEKSLVQLVASRARRHAAGRAAAGAGTPELGAGAAWQAALEALARVRERARGAKAAREGSHCPAVGSVHPRSVPGIMVRY